MNIDQLKVAICDLTAEIEDMEAQDEFNPHMEAAVAVLEVFCEEHEALCNAGRN